MKKPLRENPRRGLYFKNSISLSFPIKWVGFSTLILLIRLLRLHRACPSAFLDKTIS